MKTHLMSFTVCLTCFWCSFGFADPNYVHKQLTKYCKVFMVKLLRGDSKFFSNYKLHRLKKRAGSFLTRRYITLNEWICTASNIDDTRKYFVHMKGFPVKEESSDSEKTSAHNNAVSAHTQAHRIPVSAINYTLYQRVPFDLYEIDNTSMMIYVAITGIKSDPPDPNQRPGWWQ